MFVKLTSLEVCKDCKNHIFVTTYVNCHSITRITSLQEVFEGDKRYVSVAEQLGVQCCVQLDTERLLVRESAPDIVNAAKPSQKRTFKTIAEYIDAVRGDGSDDEE